ncbi:BTB/POZ domain-containing protein At1g63850-like isoform X2 [Rhodamnia argentea]|uniref:BTB/POZ domain-containing protein At1g63850-like isoform X2 n=1 Tax=Rhodamnia argentea TaxID=178133 RepID=A0ABM3GX24_9MYRT|nr:BTB/POZ domain-containing protein At1g63850-like isoform X2 [Rhodamnia argentea]
MAPATNTRKRHRNSAAAASTTTATVTATAAATGPASPSAIRRVSSTSSFTSGTPAPASSPSPSPSFNDSSTADVILSLNPQTSPLDAGESSSNLDSKHSDPVQIHLHSSVLHRSQYFDALLSGRWHNREPSSPSADVLRCNLPVSGPVHAYVTVLSLLYTDDFSLAITSASTALDLLPIALELLFEDCVKSCVKFLEAVPWTEEEESRVMNLTPFLKDEESSELLSRVSPEDKDSCEEMLFGLIQTAFNKQTNTASSKALVAKILREISNRDVARRVLERAFTEWLKVVKESLEEYSSPDFREDHDETEAMQRLNLHKATTYGRHLLWLVERMIELRVAEAAAKEWSEQPNFTADLQKASMDDSGRYLVPGFPAVIMRCTLKLAQAIAAGNILAARQGLRLW